MIVDIKGVGKAQFPDEMTKEQVRDFLRRKYTLRERVQDALIPREVMAQPINETLSQKMGRKVADTLHDNGIISSSHGAYRIGQNLATIGEFLPGIGDYSAADQTGRDIAEGNYGSAALNSASIIPGVPDLGIFAGTLARNAKLTQLSDLLKKQPSKKISPKDYKDSGWYYDVDGNYKFEIDDSKAVINKNLIERSKDLSGNKNHGFSSIGKLNDYIKHSELFENYPELKKVPVAIGDIDAKGAYFPTDNVIVMDKSMLDDPESFKSTLLHETQHAVQEIEGFAKGGAIDEDFAKRVKASFDEKANTAAQDYSQWVVDNANYIRDSKDKSELAKYGLMYKSMKKLIEYAHHPEPTRLKRLIGNESGWLYDPVFMQTDLRSKAMDIDRNWYNMPKRHKKQERAKFLEQQAMDLAQALREVIPDGVRQFFDADTRKLDSMIKALERDSLRASKKLQPMRDLKTAKEKTEEFTSSINERNPYDIYKRLAGEVEARNVQERINLNMQERLSKIPNLTADVSSDKQIVTFDYGKKTQLPDAP